MADQRSLAQMAPLIIFFAYTILFAVVFAVWNRRRASQRPNGATASADAMIHYWLPALIVVQVCAWSGVVLMVAAIALTTDILIGPDGQAPLLGFVIGLVFVPVFFAVFDFMWVRRMRSGDRSAPFGR